MTEESDSGSEKSRRTSKRTRKPDTGQKASQKELLEAERVSALHPLQQRNHPSAVEADPNKLRHINTYGAIPEFYIDRPFVCRSCGKSEIWRARDQKWYYEESGGHIDALAVRCNACRTASSQRDKNE